MKNRAKKNYDIFISYRRDGGLETAKHLRDTLIENGYSVFFDMESLRAGEFNKELYRVIENCKDVVLILPPNALERCKDPEDWIRLEIEHALENGKNIIPILMNGFEFPDELPESIEPIRFMNGIAANVEYYDAFLEKLMTFLQSRPKLHGVKLFAVAAAVLLLISFLTVSGVIYFGRYPRTNEQKNLVSQLIGHMVLNVGVLDRAEGVYLQTLKKCIKYMEGQSYMTDEDIQMHIADAIDQVQEMRGEIEPMDEALRSGLTDSPFDAGDMEGFMPYVNNFMDNILDRLGFVQTVILTDDSILKDTRIEHMNMLIEVAEYDGVQIYCAINETLLPVNQDDALTRFLREYWPSMTALNSDNVYQKNSDQIAGLSEGAYRKQKAAVDSFGVYMDDTNEYVAGMYENMVNQQTLYQVVDDEELEADKRTLEELKKELEAGKRELAASKAEAYEKFRPLESDDPDLLFGKISRFNTIHMPEAAIESAQMYLNKAETEADKRCARAALGMLKSKEETGVSGGVVVFLYEEGLPQQKVEIGDIIYEVDGAPVRNVAEYAQARGDEGIVEISILRFEEDGTYEKVKSVIDSSCGRLGLRGLIDEPKEES